MSKFRVEDIISILKSTSKEYNIIEYQDPDIVDVKLYDNTLYIIVYDRSDRASLIGYGGVIVKGLRKTLGVEEVVVRAVIDLSVKRARIVRVLHHLKRTIYPNVASNVRLVLKKHLEPLLYQELKYPPRLNLTLDEEDEPKAVVAFSGGPDSTASLILAKNAGFNPIAITVSPGPFIVPEDTISLVVNIAKYLKVKHYIVKPKEDFKCIIEDTLNGRRMPCSRCNPIVRNTILDYARSLNIPIVIFGDSLATSSRAVRVLSKNMVRVNLPSALALTKYDTIEISRKYTGIRYKLGYGCPLLREGMRRHRWMRFIAIERVLREARSGYLEPMEALEIVKSIIKIPYSPYREGLEAEVIKSSCSGFNF